MIAKDLPPALDARLTVTRDLDGWEIREEDHGVVKQTRYSDWHRVERALQVFELAHGRTASSGA
jgi:hypothetical protein